MLFHYGRTFEINDLAVEPEYQRRGIASALLEKCLADMKAQGIVGVHLITAGEGALPRFYANYGFKKEKEVILMGADLSNDNKTISEKRQKLFDALKAEHPTLTEAQLNEVADYVEFLEMKNHL